MQSQNDSGYKTRSNNYITIQLTQIQQEINNNYAITQNQILMNIN